MQLYSPDLTPFCCNTGLTVDQICMILPSHVEKAGMAKKRPSNDGCDVESNNFKVAF